MEIIQYSKAHHQFREKARDFMRNEITPNIDQWEKDRIMPRSAWIRMGEEKLLCASVSKEYGGLGGDFLHEVILTEELIRANHNALGPTAHSGMIIPYINTFASGKIKKKFLPGCVTGEIITAFAMTEPDTGSDISSITTTAVETGDEVIINGSKIFITNGINSDLVVLVARDPAVKNPNDAISIYLVEAGSPGFDKGQKLNKMGLHSQDTSELFFSNCRIPKENRLGEKGKGWGMLMEKLQQERILTALISLANAEHILEWTVEYFKENSGPGKPIPKSQANQFALVEMATDAKIGRTFVDKLIVDHMENKNIIIETSMAKYWVSEMAKQLGGRCMDMLGEYATIERCPIVQPWLNARSMPIFAGTNEIMKAIIGKFMGL